MKKKMNNKVILTIELVLITIGLVLSVIGAIKSLSVDLPGTVKPKDMEDTGTYETGETGEADTKPEAFANPRREENGAPNRFKATESEISANGIEESTAVAPLNNINLPQSEGGIFSFAIVYIVPILVYILLLVYVLIEYRRPHGNLLRVTMLIYAFMLAIWATAQGENAGCVYILPCTAVIIAYISGRLDKIMKNIVWFSIAAVLLITYGIIQTVLVGVDSIGIMQCSYSFGAVLQLITLALAYFSKYYEHKFAGLDDSSDKN